VQVSADVGLSDRVIARRRCMHDRAVQATVPTPEAVTSEEHQGRSFAFHYLAMQSNYEPDDATTTSPPPQQPIYQRLDASREEIRLLTLHPPLKGDDRVQCTLRPAALLSETGYAIEPPPYEALSYVWGKPDFSRPILVNDQELYITPTLTTILSSLRRTTDRTLWVDAICINQGNLAERSHQVTIMKKVYSSCQRVIAWVGPTLGTTRKHTISQINAEGSWCDVDVTANRVLVHKEQVTRAMKVMNDILAQDTRSLESFKNNFTKRHEDIMSATAPGHSKEATEEWKASRLLLHDVPYWSRMWVVQELAFAPQVTLTCENAELEWTSISKLLTNEPYFDAFHTLDDGSDGRAYDPNEKLLSMFTQVKIIEDQRRAMIDPAAKSFRNLFDVLARFRDKEAAEPTDKIYGLLGLASEDHNIEIDYEQPPELLFQEVTLSLVNASGDLDILCQNPFERRKGPLTLEHLDDENPSSMPSWVADFGLSRHKSLSILFAQRDIFNAGSKRVVEPVKVVGGNKNVLALRGSLIGQIGPMEEDWVRINRRNMFDRYDDNWRGTNLRDRDGDYSAWRILKQIGEDRQRSREGPVNPLSEIEDGQEVFHDVESSIQAFWRTMTKDCTAPPNMRRLSKDEIAELDRINTRRIRAGGPLTTCYATKVSDAVLAHFYCERPYYSHQITWKPEPEWNEGEAKLWLRQFPYRDTDYAFVTTGDGLYMLTRRHAKTGDIVAVLDGGKVPVILRRAQCSDIDDFEELYHFICVAYVHGIMDGEVEKAVERGWIEKREILLA
jgi:hypothetical protein